MLKIEQIFPKLYIGLLYVVFHNLESQNAGLVDVKKGILILKKDQRVMLCAKIKNKHC